MLRLTAQIVLVCLLSPLQFQAQSDVVAMALEPGVESQPALSDVRDQVLSRAWRAETEGRWEDALVAYFEVIEATRSDGQPLPADIAGRIGEALWMLERPEESVGWFQRQLEAGTVDPDDVTFLLLSGAAFRWSGIPERACALWRVALASDPSDSDLWAEFELLEGESCEDPLIDEVVPLGQIARRVVELGEPREWTDPPLPNELARAHVETYEAYARELEAAGRVIAAGHFDFWAAYTASWFAIYNWQKCRTMRNYMSEGEWLKRHGEAADFIRLARRIEVDGRYAWSANPQLLERTEWLVLFDAFLASGQLLQALSALGALFDMPACQWHEDHRIEDDRLLIGKLARSAFASVSFDPETGARRESADDEDFAGVSIPRTAADGTTHLQPYGSLNHFEDWAETGTESLMYAMGKSPGYPALLKQRVVAGNYELPVKHLLHRLEGAATASTPAVFWRPEIEGDLWRRLLDAIRPNTDLASATLVGYLVLRTAYPLLEEERRVISCGGEAGGTASR